MEEAKLHWLYLQSRGFLRLTVFHSFFSRHLDFCRSSTEELLELTWTDPCTRRAAPTFLRKKRHGQQMGKLEVWDPEIIIT